MFCYNLHMTDLEPGQVLLHPVEQSTVKAALRELQSALKALYGKRAPIIRLYGSYARGESNAASDIDVLLLYPAAIRPSQELQRISPILADLNLRYQVLVSVMPVSEEDYRLAADVFWKNVKREEVAIDAL
jgi:predicted nucleotidyltransferase